MPNEGGHCRQRVLLIAADKSKAMREEEGYRREPLRRGPILHHTLPQELLDKIKAIYDLIGPYLETTLEQFEVDFMRESVPEVEVAIWTKIAAAWHRYHDLDLDGLPLPFLDELTIVTALIAISTGIIESGSLDISAELWERLVQCYHDSES